MRFSKMLEYPLSEQEKRINVSINMRHIQNSGDKKNIERMMHLRVKISRNKENTSLNKK